MTDRGVVKELFITDRRTFREVLEHGEALDDFDERTIKGPFSHLISINGTWPDDLEPPGGDALWARQTVRKLRMSFDDVLVEDSHGFPPVEADVLAILVVAHELPPNGRVLIHCGAGVSRSTAAGLLILTYHMGRGHELLAVNRMLDFRKCARPHAGMVVMGDAILKRDGALVDAYRAVFGQTAEQDLERWVAS